MYMRVGVLDTKDHLQLDEVDPTSVPSSAPSSSTPTASPSYNISVDGFWGESSDHFLWAFPEELEVKSSTLCQGDLIFSNDTSSPNIISCQQYRNQKLTSFASLSNNLGGEFETVVLNYSNTSQNDESWIQRIISCNDAIFDSNRSFSFPETFRLVIFDFKKTLLIRQ